MNPAPDTSQRLLACLSDGSRYRIVRLLGGEERCVTEIARAVGLSQSCTTRHLQALARGRVVRRRREGKRVLFRLDDRDPTVRELLAWLGARPGGGHAAAPAVRDDRAVRDREGIAGTAGAGRGAQGPRRPAAPEIPADGRAQRPGRGDGPDRPGETDRARAAAAAESAGPDSRPDPGRRGASGPRGATDRPHNTGDQVHPATSPEAPPPRPRPPARPGDLEDYLL